MTVVTSQHGLIDEGWNAVRLAKYAQLTQMECAFWGILDPSEPVDEACSPILTLPEREQIARYLGEAQDEIEQVIGYPHLFHVKDYPRLKALVDEGKATKKFYYAHGSMFTWVTILSLAVTLEDLCMFEYLTQHCEPRDFAKDKR